MPHVSGVFAKTGHFDVAQRVLYATRQKPPDLVSLIRCILREMNAWLGRQVAGAIYAVAMAKYGYARISTEEQNASMQLDALKKAGCKKILKDEVTGKHANRPGLLRCLKSLQDGDTLIVWKLDRLARSLGDLIAMLDDLKKRRVKFRSLTEAIDTDTPTGRAMWQMIGVIAEFERSLITERTRAGVKAAQRRGVKFGRKPKLPNHQLDHARQLVGNGEPVRDVAKLLGAQGTLCATCYFSYDAALTAATYCSHFPLLTSSSAVSMREAAKSRGYLSLNATI